MTDTMTYQPTFQEEFEAEFNAVMEWLAAFNGNGKTYAQFGVEYLEAAKRLEAMLNDPATPADLAAYTHQLGDAIELMGFNYATVDEGLTAGDLIRGHQVPGGRAVNRSLNPPRPHLVRMLRDVEFGNPGASPTTSGQRVAQGRQHFAALRLSEDDRGWVAAELDRIERNPRFVDNDLGTLRP